MYNILYKILRKTPKNKDFAACAMSSKILKNCTLSDKKLKIEIINIFVSL